MKLKFKTQAYQTAAVQAVIDCFKGQVPHHGGVRYRLDPGSQKAALAGPQGALTLEAATHEAAAEKEAAFRNADFNLSDTALLENIRAVQQGQNLPISDALVKTKVAKVNLDVEMETGTGKTYCYIKTIFELNKQYGWSKFIIVVPSIAIREGVAKSLQITSEHFLETYQKKARFFIYNSKQLHHLESFSSDAGINVMVINVQAFAARGADNRRIYDVLDDFQSRKPIDVISANRPILILDEPQTMEGAATLKSLEEFKALMVLRYSATHKTTHNKIHRLDALDAYNQKLVKKIAVRGIAVKGLAGTAGYMYLQSIEISSKKPPEARVEFEQKLAGGNIKRVVRKLSKGDNLFDLSNGLDQYRDGFVVADINANSDTLSFTNGVELTVGDATGDVTEAALRRIQIREAIKAHFDKEQALFQQGVKVLTLYFIDEVVKYRDYDSPDEKGDYARIFEEEYQLYLNEVLDLDETHPDTDASRGTNRHAPSPEPQPHAQGTSASADMSPATDTPVPEPEADAQITTRPGIALAVQVADCLPVLLADRQGRVIGAAHAGWRSLAGGILQATVQKMRQKVPDADIVAWLGPCIGPAVFEVGDEVRAAFIAAAQDMATHLQGRPPEQEDSKYTACTESAFQPGRKPGKWMANLPELARQHLHALGITDIHTAGACTFSDPARFWSYRRDQTCGRMAGLVWIKP